MQCAITMATSRRQDAMLAAGLRLPVLLVALLLLLVVAPTVPAAALLSCDVVYGGDTQTITATVRADPYDIDSVDISERFRFKATMIGQRGNDGQKEQKERIDYIKLYVYFQTRQGDVLIQQASFEPPFPIGKTAQPLGPRTFLYAGPLERELQYNCTLNDD